jgi:hypothetical protein
MRLSLLLALSASLVGLARPCLALPDAPHWSVVEATLTEVQDISDQPGAPHICLDDSCTASLDGSWRVKFEIDRTLSGAARSGAVFLDQASARPRLNFKYLLVVVDQKGRSEIEWAGLKRYGLCVSQDEIQRIGLADAAAQLPCRH